jgi:uncharacterized protein (TIGR02996 family)
MPTLEAARATEAAFIEDVCLHPGDDTPRLILADWLDEHGRGERAEFIRVQCELARTPEWVRAGVGRIESVLNPRYETLRRRERELLAARGYGWCDGLFGTDWKVGGGPKGQDNVHVHYFNKLEQADTVLTFRRGFVEEVTLPAATFLAHAAALFRAAPGRRVTLFGREPSQHPGQSGRGRWYWPIAPPVSADPRRVPLALWNLLEAHERCDDGAPLWCSRTAALDALAAACLLYGRRAAWPCPSCKGRGRNGAVPSLPGWPCPACAGRGHTVEGG